MNLNSIKELALRHKRVGWVGLVLQTDDVLELVNRIEQLEKGAEEAAVVFEAEEIEEADT